MDAMAINLDDSVSPGETRRAAIHGERLEAIERLREQILALEEREPELKQEITEFEKTQRSTIAELEKTLRTTTAELEKTQRATIAELEKALRAKPENAEELEVELEDTRTKLDEELEHTRTRLEGELERTRTELAEKLAAMRAEFAAIRPSVIDARCKLGMKMSDFALEEHDGHEQAIEYLQPLLVELRSAYSRALSEAKRNADEVDETLKTLHEEHRATTDATLPLVEQRYDPLIHAQATGATIEQAKARIARHQLALVDSEELEPDEAKQQRLARELVLEAALVELDAARAKVLGLQEEKEATAYHYRHPNAEKSKRLGEKLTKRFGHRH